MNIEVAQAVGLTGIAGAAILGTQFARDMLAQRAEDLSWAFTYRHRDIKRQYYWLLAAGTPLIASVGFALGCLGGLIGQIVAHTWKVLIA